jgi:hypothetical protein
MFRFIIGRVVVMLLTGCRKEADSDGHQALLKRHVWAVLDSSMMTIFFNLLNPTGYVMQQQFNLLNPTGYAMHQQFNLFNLTGYVMHQQFNLLKPTGHVMHQPFKIVLSLFVVKVITHDILLYLRYTNGLSNKYICLYMYLFISRQPPVSQVLFIFEFSK